MKKVNFVIVVFALSIIPQIALASWWNPFTWKSVAPQSPNMAPQVQAPTITTKDSATSPGTVNNTRAGNGEKLTGAAKVSVSAVPVPSGYISIPFTLNDNPSLGSFDSQFHYVPQQAAKNYPIGVFAPDSNPAEMESFGGARAYRIDILLDDARLAQRMSMAVINMRCSGSVVAKMLFSGNVCDKKANTTSIDGRGGSGYGDRDEGYSVRYGSTIHHGHGNNIC